MKEAPSRNPTAKEAQTDLQEQLRLGIAITSLRNQITLLATQEGIKLKKNFVPPETHETLPELVSQLHDLAFSLALQNKDLIPYAMRHQLSKTAKDLSIEDKEDLKQECFIALWEAALKYDPGKDNPHRLKPLDINNFMHFSTYAVTCLKGVIIKNANSLHMVKISPQNMDEYRAYKTTQSAITKEQQQKPTHEQVVAHIDRNKRSLSPKEWENYLRDKGNASRFFRLCKRYQLAINAIESQQSLNATKLISFMGESGTESGEISPLENIADEKQTEAFEKERLPKDVEKALQLLTDREREVIKMYHGIGYAQPLSFNEIDIYYQRSHKTSRNIYERALRKLRHPTRSRALRGYLG